MTHGLRRWLAGLYTLSPEKVVRRSRAFWGQGQEIKPAPVTVGFLKSEEYRELMGRHLPWDGSYDLNEAQNETMNFRFRHHEMRERLSVYRWRGIQENLDLILSHITAPEKKIVDFGGAASPLGLGSIIVDRLAEDLYKQPVPFSSLEGTPAPVHVVFSSHTLEHIPELEEMVGMMADSLVEGGAAILHLPAFSCERWRAGRHRHDQYSDHVWTFGLEPAPRVPGLVNYIQIDSLVSRRLQVEKAAYCGDNSIFILAKKGKAP